MQRNSKINSSKDFVIEEENRVETLCSWISRPLDVKIKNYNGAQKTVF